MVAKTVSIVNMKGGVGKTTICLNLAHWLVDKQNKKVLVIDFDPQSNASEGLLKYEDYDRHRKENKVISDIFTDIHKLVSPVKTEDDDRIELENMLYKVKEMNNGSCLHLVPSELELCHTLERPISGHSEDRLSLLLKGKKNRYDYVLIDCGPTYSLLTINALNASDYILIPVKPDPFSVRGIPMMIKQINVHNLASFKAQKVEILGIVFTLVKDLATMTSIKAEILRIHPGIFQTEIRHCEWYPNALLDNTSIFETRAQRHFKDNFEDFAKEFLQKIEGGT